MLHWLSHNFNFFFLEKDQQCSEVFRTLFAILASFLLSLNNLFDIEENSPKYPGDIQGLFYFIRYNVIELTFSFEETIDWAHLCKLAKYATPDR